MFEAVKNNFKRQKLIRLLAFVVAGTQSTAGCAYLPEKEANELFATDNTLVEVNASIKDDKGNLATRATAAGIAASNADAAAAPAATANTEAVIFTLEDNVAVPAIKRGGGPKADVYPFEKMAVGQSFFVPSTEKRPNPAKSLASTVSSATKRYAEATGENETVTIRGKQVTRPKMKLTRIFTVRVVDGGARVWRTQ